MKLDETKEKKVDAVSENKSICKKKTDTKRHIKTCQVALVSATNGILASQQILDTMHG